MNNIPINSIFIKKIKYPKIKKAYFYDTPSTSAQEKVFTRITDTSKNTVYPNNRYKFIKNIGDGSASVIYLAEDKINKNKVIVKKIKKNEYWTKELKILEFLRTKTSDKIIKILDYFESNKRSYIVMKFYEGFDLFEHIDLNAPYPLKKGILIINEMAKCIKECHDNGILHLDIKCENFVVETNKIFENDRLVGKIILIDFGHSENNKSMNKLYKGFNYGTDYYLCPEGNYNIYSSKSDIWCLGICISLILSGDFPFLGSEKEYYKNASSYKIHLKNRIEESGYNILKKCLNPNPSLRPSIDEVLYDINKICLNNQ